MSAREEAKEREREKEHGGGGKGGEVKVVGNARFFAVKESFSVAVVVFGPSLSPSGRIFTIFPPTGKFPRATEIP